MASASVENLPIIFFIFAFKLAQNFSIGLKSGEYGGRNTSWHPASAINFFVY